MFRITNKSRSGFCYDSTVSGMDALDFLLQMGCSEGATSINEGHGCASCGSAPHSSAALPIPFYLTPIVLVRQVKL